MTCRLLLLSLALCRALLAQAQPNPPEIVVPKPARGNVHPVFRVQNLSPVIASTISHTTWHPGCPVPVGDLRLLVLSYWNYAGEPATGLLIANKAVAKDLRTIFRKLFRHGFMIARMEPVENYGGNDELSMEANNTSAFNCRDVTLHPGKFSNHSWGRAVDVNTLTNPYVKGATVLPPGGRAYLDRTRAYAGGILADGYAVKLFRSRGWTWGGSWTDRQDYQHFEKPQR
jgi:hypothetical protein